MLEGIRLLMEDKMKTGAHSEITETIHNLRELTKIAEHEMHEAVLSCKRARRQLLRQFSASKPVLH